MRPFFSHGRDSVEPRPLGCPACLDLAMREAQPTLLVTTSPDDSLYRCDYCQMWWTGNSRFRHPTTADAAQARFPE